MEVTLSPIIEPTNNKKTDITPHQHQPGNHELAKECGGVENVTSAAPKMAERRQ